MKRLAGIVLTCCCVLTMGLAGCGSKPDAAPKTTQATPPPPPPSVQAAIDQFKAKHQGAQ